MIPSITSSTSDLLQILALQKRNLKSNLSDDEKRQQGFLTVGHSLEMLQQMHDEAPSIVVRDGEQIVAYALTMLPSCRTLIPDLVPMFENFELLKWKGKPLTDHRFYVMGQICVDRNYRGQGLFDMLYQHHKTIYSDRFDLLVTEISTGNTRSLRAHERVGFKTVNVYRDALDEWAVVIWDWRR